MSNRSTGSARLIRIPKYRAHKGSDQVAVTINGKNIYLGKFGTLESHEKYRKLVSEYLAQHGQQPLPPAQNNVALLAIRRNRRPITVIEACAEYMKFCKEHQPNQVSAVKSMQKLFTGLFKHELAANIGPLALKEIRKAMVAYRDKESDN